MEWEIAEVVMQLAQELIVTRFNTEQLALKFLDDECWDDENGNLTTPRKVLEAIQSVRGNYGDAMRNHPLLLDHIAAIKEADPNYPILLGPDGTVIDGAHRVIKALLNGASDVPIRRFETMPEDAKMQS